MPRKRLPIFHKVSKILKVSIFLAKMRKVPVIPRLVLFRKSHKRLRKFKLLQNKHYNYGFIAEYEFSPSKTRPLIRCDQSKEIKFSHGSLRKVYSMLFLCRRLRAEGGDNVGDGLNSLQLEALPAVDHEEGVESGALFRPLDWGDEEEEEEDSIDLRAERFIERFYEEMRIERQASL